MSIDIDDEKIFIAPLNGLLMGMGEESSGIELLDG